MNIEALAKEIFEAQKNFELQLGLKKSVNNFTDSVEKVLNSYPYLAEMAKHVKLAKDKVLKNLDYYMDRTLNSVKATGANAYFAENKASALQIVKRIVGEEKKVIIKAKSMVTEELALREYLSSMGHEVYETDLGEFLIQIAKDKPMHTIVPALHLAKERAAQLLRNKAGLPVNEGMSHEEIVLKFREFFRTKFIKAEIGISGANAIAADTGSVFLIHNEGNISNVVTLPPTHIIILGVEKIMPTFKDAVFQAVVQAGYAGLYPPTYFNVVSGPSSTADLEYHRVYGAHGAKEVHVILYNGGRINALKNGAKLKEQLYCVKCGRCQISCPIWGLSGNIWGGKVYGGPMGMGWTAITEGVEAAEPLSWFCLLCNICKISCPVEIDFAEISRTIRAHSVESGHTPPKVKEILENIYKYGNPFGLPRAKRAEWADSQIPLYKTGDEYLYYVGDLGSYHPRAQQAAKTLANMLSKAKVNYGILGALENCSGSEAYELGETGLLETIIKKAIALLEKLRVEKIVTLSPHSYHIMKNFYSDLGGFFNVKHYTQLLWESIKNKRLNLKNSSGFHKTITYHDPCFLGRYNSEYDAPRNILKAIPGVKIVEMKRNRQKALCCGGGSGNSYIGFACGLLTESEKTPSRERILEAVETGAEILAVACPSCLIMLEEAVKDLGLDEKIQVKDITEIIDLAFSGHK
jgi:L-lactate dehydrogenase complex protein LldG